MSGKRKHMGRMIARYIITFVLMVCLLGISLLGYGKYSMLSVHGVVNACERVGYFEDICDEMKTEAYYYISGIIEEEELRNIVKQMYFD